jgi:hypothetical protein
MILNFDTYKKKGNEMTKEEQLRELDRKIYDTKKKVDYYNAMQLL